MVHNACYPPTFMRLPTIIFGQKYYRSLQRSQYEKQTTGAYKDLSMKNKSNLEEQATSNDELNTNITRV